MLQIEYLDDSQKDIILEGKIDNFSNNAKGIKYLCNVTNSINIPHLLVTEILKNAKYFFLQQLETSNIMIPIDTSLVDDYTFLVYNSFKLTF